MGVEMHHAHRLLPVDDTAEDRQGDEVVAACGERHGPGRADPRIEPLDLRQGVGDVRRIDWDVAQVGDAREVVRGSPGDRMDAANQARLVADRSGAVAGAGAVGRAAVPGNANQADIDSRRVGGVGQPHEGGNTGETGHNDAGDRLDGLRVIHRTLRRLASRWPNYTRATHDMAHQVRRFTQPSGLARRVRGCARRNGGFAASPACFNLVKDIA
jgi:hypothetical protein